MTVEMFDHAINGIHAELIEECAYINTKPRHRLSAVVRYTSIAAVFVLFICGGVFSANHLLSTHIFKSNGGNVSNYNISDGKLEITGNGFTDEEIHSVVENNKEIIALNVSAEYNCFGSEIQIYTKGYYHAFLGEKNCVDLDYLTLPVCVDNRIVANLEVFKVNEELQYSLNVGGDRWDIINKALEYDNNIAFVFSGGYAGETAIAPDNTVFEITGTLSAKYNFVATEYNTFSRSVLYDNNNYITFVSEKQIDSDDTMRDDNNEKVTYSPISPNVSCDGNVLLISTLMSQIGKTPLLVSKEESALLIQMLNKIEMQPIDFPDPMNIPIGGGYIIEIEGKEKYELLGGRYIKIGDRYYYDKNGKSDELSAKIGNVLYDYYGEH